MRADVILPPRREPPSPGCVPALQTSEAYATLAVVAVLLVTGLGALRRRWGTTG